MSAFFFGQPGRQLFGYHHPPRGTAITAAALCPPWAGEYQFAHRALHSLAKRLAARGCHVLRFDLSGVGDSWGDSTNFDLDQWTDDLREAIGEIRALSGLQQVDLVGLRGGAYVAARGAASVPGVRRIVYWDPVTNGNAWLREWGLPIGMNASSYVSLGSWRVPAKFVGQVRRLRPESYTPGSAERVLVLLTQIEDRTTAGDALAEDFGVEMEWLEQPAAWVEDRSIWQGQVPARAVERIAEWLT